MPHDNTPGRGLTRLSSPTTPARREGSDLRRESPGDRDREHGAPFAAAVRQAVKDLPSGRPWGDVDDEQARRLAADLILPIGRRRDLRAGFAGWTAPAWAVLFAIQNHEFRPTWEKVEAIVRSKFDEPREEDRPPVVVAPPAPDAAPVQDPQQAIEWIDDFASATAHMHEGAARIVLRLLLRLPTPESVRTAIKGLQASAYVEKDMAAEKATNGRRKGANPEKVTADRNFDAAWRRVERRRREA